MGESEVARIKRQIEDEYNAASQALHGSAVVAQHKIITARMERMGALHEQLKGLVGDEEANEFLVQTMQEKGKDDGKD